MDAYRILQGDALDVLGKLPDESVHCCVTSPPYYGLRDYGVDGQIGLERTPAEYIARLVDVFREVRRVLRSDGCCWINIGDSYSSQGGPQVKQTKWQVEGASDGQNAGQSRQSVAGLKPKDLIGIPWMLAFALRDDGWWLRQDIIWNKSAPMPESVKDRCTRSHEYLFMLAKSAKYHYDATAIAEPTSSSDIKKFTDGGYDKQRGHGKRHAGFNGRYAAKLQRDGVPETRNKRSVWTLAPQPTREAHFATFPIELPETCILASCPTGGIVLDPFAGSGTTGLAALKHGRQFIGIELNARYIEIARRRVEQHYPLLAKTEVA